MLFGSFLLGPMAHESLSDQIEALKSFFCMPKEFEEHAGPKGLHITLLFDATGLKPPYKRGMSFLVPCDYPQSNINRENISVFSEGMSERQITILRHEIERMLDLWEGQPTLLELCCFVKEHFEIHTNNLEAYIPEVDETFSEEDKEISNHGANAPDAICDEENDRKMNITYSPDISKSSATCEKTCESFSSHQVTSVLQLDHMRSRANYIKYIKKWTGELNLNGKLIFCKKYIFIVLQGRHTDIKDYIIRNKTVSVDVDSRGRSCKERLLNSLCEVHARHHTKFTDFDVIDGVPNIEALSSLFESFLMTDIFEEYISPCLSIPKNRLNKK